MEFVLKLIQTYFDLNPKANGAIHLVTAIILISYNPDKL